MCPTQEDINNFLSFILHLKMWENIRFPFSAKVCHHFSVIFSKFINLQNGWIISFVQLFSRDQNLNLTGVCFCLRRDFFQERFPLQFFTDLTRKLFTSKFERQISALPTAVRFWVGFAKHFMVWPVQPLALSTTVISDFASLWLDENFMVRMVWKFYTRGRGDYKTQQLLRWWVL